jgi:4-hydroxy 2-oxovalerate aldolase
MALDYRVKCCPDGLVSDRRRRVKVLDCTIRDGGICNDWHFNHDLVGQVFRALAKSGIDYMEVGYKTTDGLFDRDKVGPWRFCDEEDLLKAGIEPGQIKLSTMLDCGRVDVTDIPKKEDTVIDVLRIATYAKDMDEALRLLDHALECGYETFMNVMAVSTLPPDEVDKFLLRLADSGVHNVAIVDSFGALYPFHIRYLVHKYMNYLGKDIKVGVHTHNNQQQAFANSIAAIDEGVDFVDATVHGIGRGAGNCPLELLLFYLDNPQYNVAPVLDLVETFGYMRDDLRWGYHLPYAITGYYNMHPRDGIERMATAERYQVREMYEKFSGRLEQRVRRTG